MTLAARTIFVALLAIQAPALVATAAEATKLPVSVSILPQAYFVERVGGEHVDVQVLVGPGQSPHSLQPTARQIARLGEARIYFRIGVNFETALFPRIERLFPELDVVDLRSGVQLRHIDGSPCDHGDDDAHAPTQRSTADAARQHAPRHDPHIWLSPRLVKIQARTICDALCRHAPQHSAAFRRNLAEFEQDLDRVHDEIAAALKPLKGRRVYVFHPAFGYFLDEFNLEQVPVEVEGKSPTPRQLADLIERARAEQVRVIFVQPQFAQDSAKAVAESIDGVVVPINPLAREYLDNLRDIARQIRAGLSPTAATTRP